MSNSDFSQWRKRADKAPERKFTDEEARQIGEAVGADFSKHDFQQFKMGLPVEWEHKDTVGGDLETVGRIVLDHLNEFPDYYDRLKKAEASVRTSTFMPEQVVELASYFEPGEDEYADQLRGRQFVVRDTRIEYTASGRPVEFVLHEDLQTGKSNWDYASYFQPVKRQYKNSPYDSESPEQIEEMMRNAGWRVAVQTDDPDYLYREFGTHQDPALGEIDPFDPKYKTWFTGIPEHVETDVDFPQRITDKYRSKTDWSDATLQKKLWDLKDVSAEDVEAIENELRRRNVTPYTDYLANILPGQMFEYVGDPNARLLIDNVLEDGRMKATQFSGDRSMGSIPISYWEMGRSLAYGELRPIDFEPDQWKRQTHVHKMSRIVKRKDGYHVVSEKGKNLGGPYESRKKAEERLRQVEYFKHQGNTSAWVVAESAWRTAEADPSMGHPDNNPVNIDIGEPLPDKIVVPLEEPAPGLPEEDDPFWDPDVPDEDLPAPEPEEQPEEAPEEVPEEVPAEEPEREKVPAGKQSAWKRVAAGDEEIVAGEGDKGHRVLFIRPAMPWKGDKVKLPDGRVGTVFSTDMMETGTGKTGYGIQMPSGDREIEHWSNLTLVGRPSLELYSGSAGGKNYIWQPGEVAKAGCNSLGEGKIIDLFERAFNNDEIPERALEAVKAEKAHFHGHLPENLRRVLVTRCPRTMAELESRDSKLFKLITEGHQAPFDNCNCGIYAVTPRNFQEMEGYAKQTPYVVVELELTGKLKRGRGINPSKDDEANVWRAEGAKIDQIMVPPNMVYFDKYTSEDLANMLQQQYGVPAKVENPPFEPHRPRGMDPDVSNFEFKPENVFDAESWNLAKRKRPAEEPPIDLSGADLAEGDGRYRMMSMTDLSDVNLSGANLAGIDFKSVNFKNANLTGADLTDAKFAGATVLFNANLTGTKIAGADFTMIKNEWLPNLSMAVGIEDAKFDRSQRRYLLTNAMVDDNTMAIWKEEIGQYRGEVIEDFEDGWTIQELGSDEAHQAVQEVKGGLIDSFSYNEYPYFLMENNVPRAVFITNRDDEIMQIIDPSNASDQEIVDHLSEFFDSERMAWSKEAEQGRPEDDPYYTEDDLVDHWDPIDIEDLDDLLKTWEEIKDNPNQFTESELDDDSHYNPEYTESEYTDDYGLTQWLQVLRYVQPRPIRIDEDKWIELLYEAINEIKQGEDDPKWVQEVATALYGVPAFLAGSDAWHPVWEGPTSVNQPVEADTLRQIFIREIEQTRQQLAQSTQSEQLFETEEYQQGPPSTGNKVLDWFLNYLEHLEQTGGQPYSWQNQQGTTYHTFVRDYPAPERYGPNHGQVDPKWEPHEPLIVPEGWQAAPSQEVQWKVGDKAAVGNQIGTIIELMPDRAKVQYDNSESVITAPLRMLRLPSLMSDEETWRQSSRAVYSFHDLDGTLDTIKLGGFIAREGIDTAAQELFSYYKKTLGYDSTSAIEKSSKDLFWMGVSYDESLPILADFNPA